LKGAFKMNGREAFKIWAPKESVWSAWAKPASFVNIRADAKELLTSSLSVPEIFFRDIINGRTDCAVVLDLPGKDGVEEGLAYAKTGFRPIPLYNVCSGQHGAKSLVDSVVIESALYCGAERLKTISIAADAPPVFLLDTNRTHHHKMSVSMFDNSWDIYQQDFPSAAFFFAHGIDTIILRSSLPVKKDMALILNKYQSHKLKILFTDGFTTPYSVKIEKPKRYQG